MGKKGEFNIPGWRWDGELLGDLPGQDTSGLFGDGEVAPPPLTPPDHADYGLSESTRSRDPDSTAATETTE